LTRAGVAEPSMWPGVPFNPLWIAIASWLSGRWLGLRLDTEPVDDSEVG
jgi:hypothetical protein